MDVKSGEILALVSLPDDEGAQGTARNNHATYDRYEIGSVMKIFNHALAIESGYPRDALFNVGQPFFIGRFQVRDSHPPKPVITMDEAFIFTSNIASAHIAGDLGAKKQSEFFQKLGFFDPVKLELPELRRPQLPPKWGPVENAVAGYGYGIALTPMHIIVAANSIVNYGMSVQPTLIKRSPDEPLRYVQMVGFGTAKEMRELMERVVDEGTARRAKGAKAEAIGKTGTAFKNNPAGGYLKTMRTFFFSAFPREAPKYTMLIMLDDARNGTCAEASCTAVEASRRIIDEIEPLLNI
jgi:cell division protein FtsI (penicillin-binding protein 3)